jgi:hypothetical protein
MIKSYIDGSQIKHYSAKRKKERLQTSGLYVTSLILAVMGLVIMIYFLKFSLLAYTVIGRAGAQTLASIGNSIQIQVSSFFYAKVALEITDRENHR